MGIQWMVFPRFGGHGKRECHGRRGQDQREPLAVRVGGEEAFILWWSLMELARQPTAAIVVLSLTSLIRL
jgi:hypothetical protein